MYKIFINDKPFVISSSDVADAELTNCVRVHYSPEKLLEYIKQTELLSSRGTIMLCDDAELAFKDMYTHFVPVEAAGGLVYNTFNELLMIKRMGKWDLPKGKIDPGESREQAALREVEEECGIKGLKLIEQLPTTYHTYKMHNYRFLKITYWFKMKTEFKGKLTPQVEEQITEVKWITRNEAVSSELDTYFSIHSLLKSTIDN
ncbi:MAG: NUDIX hydrolase [Bacteroidota bacterium]|jgi:ADP-ribose pyrophosphatase YjhB (NUDIX family)